MTEGQSPNPQLERYMSYIIRRRAVSEDEIEQAIHTSIKDQMDIDSENPAILAALQETIRYHPNSSNIIREFLRKYYHDTKVEEIISVAQVEKKISPQTGRPGAMTVNEEEAIERLEHLYRIRTPSSLDEAVKLAKDLLKSGKLDEQQKQRLEIRLNQIEDLIQRGSFSTELPEEVAITFNQHQTPYNLGMWSLAHDYVETARKLLYVYIEKEPQKYGHLSDWSEASRIITYCKEMMEIQGFKNKAEELINTGNWEEAEKYYRMYSSIFEDDQPVLEKLERLKELLLVLSNVETVANGEVDVTTYRITELSTWLKILENSAPVLASSSKYSEILSSFRDNVQSSVDKEISTVQTKLDELSEIHLMSDVKLALDEIGYLIQSIKPLVTKGATEFNRSFQRYKAKKSNYEEYLVALSLVESDSEKELLDGLRIFEVSEREFGKKDELRKFRQHNSERLIQKGSKQISIMKSILSSSIIKRIKIYIDRAQENFTDRELIENETFVDLVRLLKIGKFIRISFVVLFIIGIMSFLGFSIFSNREKLANTTQTAIALAHTPTITFTPVVITNTPLPSDTPSPTVTATIPPTPYPNASVNAQQEPYFFQVYDTPNGIKQTAYVINNQPVMITTCVEINGITWVEIIFGDGLSIKGWLELDKFDNINGTLSCTHIPNP